MGGRPQVYSNPFYSKPDAPLIDGEEEQKAEEESEEETQEEVVNIENYTIEDEIKHQEI